MDANRNLLMLFHLLRWAPFPFLLTWDYPSDESLLVCTAQHGTSAYHILLAFGDSLEQGLLCNFPVSHLKASVTPVSGTVHNEEKPQCIFCTVTGSHGKRAIRATKAL